MEWKHEYHDSGRQQRHDALALDDAAALGIGDDEEVQLLEVRLDGVAVVADHAAGEVLQGVLLHLQPKMSRNLGTIEQNLPHWY